MNNANYHLYQSVTRYTIRKRTLLSENNSDGAEDKLSVNSFLKPGSNRKSISTAALKKLMNNVLKNIEPMPIAMKLQTYGECKPTDPTIKCMQCWTSRILTLSLGVI